MFKKEAGKQFSLFKNMNDKDYFFSQVSIKGIRANSSV